METLKVKGMMCHGCEARCEKALKEMGVSYVKADHEKGTVEIDSNGVNLELIKNAIEDLGFDVI